MGSSRSEMQCPEFESPMDHHEKQKHPSSLDITGLAGVFLCTKQIVQGTEFREFRNDFSGCRVDILLDHFKGGMA